MKNIIYNFIIKNSLLQSSKRIVIGLSGGADSTALLRVLLELSEKLGLTLFAVHVNHNMRGCGSEHDERFCIGICKQFNIPIRVYNVDIHTFAKERKLSKEESGRVLRYNAFADATAFFNAGLVAVAHNKNDQAETLLMRLIRGTGMKGLSSMRPLRDNIIRPLLCATRSQIETYLSSLNQPYCNDCTNSSYDYTRNKIRGYLLPAIIEGFNPSAIDTIARTASIICGENDFIEAQTETAYKNVAEDGKINILKLKTLHPAIAKRVIRLSYKNAAGTLHDLELAQIESIFALLDCKPGKNISGKTVALANSFNAYIEYGMLYFGKRFDEPVMPGCCYELGFGKPVFIKSTGCYAMLANENTDVQNVIYSACIDKNMLTGSIHIRFRQDGDIIKISGVGTKKLSDYFTDRKVPKYQRGFIPLLVIGGNIACIASGNKRTAFFDKRYAPANPKTDTIQFIYWRQD